MSSEGQSLAVGKASDASMLRDDGDWLPPGSDDLRLPSHAELLRNALGGETPNRDQRRALGKLIAPSGSLTRFGQQGMRKFAPDFVAAVERQYPLTEISRKAVEDYAFGREAGDKAMATVLRSLRQPTVLATWLESQWSMVSPLTNWLRASGQDFKVALAKLSDRLDALTKDAIRNGLDYAKTREMIDRNISDLRARIALAGIAKARDVKVDEYQPNGTIEELAPGSWTSACVMTEVIAQHMIDKAFRREAKSSDAGDIVHCLYLPYVDLFRADAYISDVIRRTLPSYFPRVVSKLRDLPDRIQKCIDHVGPVPPV